MKFRLLLLVNTLLISAGLMAQESSYYQEDFSLKGCPSSCYSASDSCGSCFSNLFVNVAFTYWHADQDGLDIANSALVTANGIGGFVIAAGEHSHTLKQKSDYAPGFKIGIGSKLCDNWSLIGEYTWFRKTTHTHSNNPGSGSYGSYGSGFSSSGSSSDFSSASVASDGDAVWVLNNWFIQTTDQGQPIAASSVSSKWRLGLDLFDISARRSLCQGCNYGLSTFFGLRAAWIRQSVKVDIDVPASLNGSSRLTSAYSHNNSNSWGVGPRVGLNSYWSFGQGFRVEGDVAVSLLYTEYTKLSHNESVASVDLTPSSLGTSLHDYNSLRPNLEMKLGLGWETCLCGCDVDFLVTYDFMIFWEQNMSRKLMDQTINGVGGSAGNLNLHGLTVNCLVNF